MGTELAHGLRAWRMSGAEFRTFQSGRPDHEQWELIGGVPMMMTPPTIAHNDIASNLAWLLNDALSRHDASRRATQRPGLELKSDEYKPEPDIAVIDADYQLTQRFIARAYLLAEIISSTDAVAVPGTSRTWIDVKREIYLAHEACEAVLLVEQDRIEVRVDVKGPSGWQSYRLGAEDELSLPGFGLRCAVTDLYRGTPLLPRPRDPS